MGPTCSRIRALTLRPSSIAASSGRSRPIKSTCHLVDGEDRGDGQAAFDGFDDAVMIVDIKLMTSLDQDDAGTHAFSVGDDGAGFYPVGFCFVAGSDATGCVGHHGHDADGLAAELGPVLLFTRGEIGVEIDEEPIQIGGVLAARGWRRRI